MIEIPCQPLVVEIGHFGVTGEIMNNSREIGKLRSDQAAKRLGLNSAAFYKAIQRGTLAKAGVDCSIWVGGQRRFLKEQIDRLVDPNTGCMTRRLGKAG